MEPDAPRRITEWVDRLMRDEPVVLLQGPRTVGKSTIVRAVAGRYGVSVFDLDEVATRDLVAADPATVAAGPPPVCVDEFQHAPLILDAIKAELNRRLAPGRFVLTGSTRYDALPSAAQSLTGRVHVATVLPFSQGEIDGRREHFVERLLDDPSAVIAAVPGAAVSATTREEYAMRAARGGFPLAVRRSTTARSRWFDQYVAVTLERDVSELRRLRQRARLPRLLAALAAQTAQVLNMRLASERVGLDDRTGEDYVRLLEAVFLVRRLPAWGTTLRARVAARPKLHVLDSGVAARLLRVSEAGLARIEPTAMTQFGHLFETFVVGEVFKQLSWLDTGATCGHWRTHDGAEVDLIIERDDGTVVAIEVKAGRRVAADDLRPLVALRNLLGTRFAAGIVLYTGHPGYVADERIAVMPADRLWSPA